MTRCVRPRFGVDYLSAGDYDGLMKTCLAALISITAACLNTPTPPPQPDAAPASCESAVLTDCGPRPARPAVDTDRWGHDIDLWAKCAEAATPILAGD